MFRKLSFAIVALLMSSAALAEANTAKVVIYRADEATKTQRIKFAAAVDNRDMGRLRYDRPVVVELEPGTYTLATSLPGSQDIELSVSAGGTYYVHAAVSKVGHTVQDKLQVVEEKVATAQRPEVAGAI